LVHVASLEKTGQGGDYYGIGLRYKKAVAGVRCSSGRTPRERGLAACLQTAGSTRLAAEQHGCESISVQVSILEFTNSAAAEIFAGKDT